MSVHKSWEHCRNIVWLCLWSGCDSNLIFYNHENNSLLLKSNNSSLNDYPLIQYRKSDFAFKTNGNAKHDDMNESVGTPLGTSRMVCSSIPQAVWASSLMSPRGSTRCLYV